MSFIKHLTNRNDEVLLEHKEPGESDEIQRNSKHLTETVSSFDEILKAAGIKIKSKIQTDFGNQYEFFKKNAGQDEISIDNLFPDNEVMFKNNFIFVVS